jgi:putative membrane protein
MLGAVVRTIKEVPNSISYAGRKSLSALEEAGKITKRTPAVLGLGRLRVVKKAPGPTVATLDRYVPRREHIQRTGMPRAMIMFGALLVVALATSLIGYIDQAFRTSRITGLLLSPIFTIALVAVTFWFWRQFRSWQSLAIVEQLQSDLSSPCVTEAEQERFRTAFAELRLKASDPQLVEFLRSANVMADADVINEQGDLDRIGLKGMDKNAVDAIRDGTRDVFFLSFVSTNVLVELIIFSLRALGLIRRVASAYGYRPGRSGIFRLARHVLANIGLLPIAMLVGLEAGRQAGSAIRSVTNGAAAAASLTPIPMAGAAIGTIGNFVGDVVEGVTPRAAQATMAAGRIAHLGLLAAAIVRPIAFSRAGYSEIRNAVYKQILGLRREATRSSKNGSDALSEKGSVSKLRVAESAQST